MLEKKSNENIILEKVKTESDKRLLTAEIVIAIITTISFLIILFTSLYAIYELNYYILPIIMISFGTTMFIIALLFCLRIEQKAGFYLCKKCGHKHIPTYKQVLLAPHINRTRYLKCPKCKQKSWNKKILK